MQNRSWWICWAGGVLVLVGLILDPLTKPEATTEPAVLGTTWEIDTGGVPGSTPVDVTRVEGVNLAE